MEIAANTQMGTTHKPRYGRKVLLRARPQKFTRGAQKSHPRRISDLEWQVKFTKMKLGLWRDLHNDKWEHLAALHKQAKKDLREQKKLCFG